MPMPCSINGCENTVHIRVTGLCSVHRKYGHAAVFVIANGMGPYDCFFCGLPVATIDNNGRGPGHFADEGCVHHIDGNHDNNIAENLAAAHQGCHSTHHMLSDNKAQMMSARGNENGKAGKIGGANSFGRDRERAAAMGRMNGPAAAKKLTSLRRATSCGFESNIGNVAKHTRKCGCVMLEPQ